MELKASGNASGRGRERRRKREGDIFLYKPDTILTKSDASIETRNYKDYSRTTWPYACLLLTRSFRHISILHTCISREFTHPYTHTNMHTRSQQILVQFGRNFISIHYPKSLSGAAIISLPFFNVFLLPQLCCFRKLNYNKLRELRV